MPENKQIVAFDGHCGLCSRVVQFILRHERSHELYFTPLTSGLAEELRQKYAIDESIDSVILFNQQEERSYIKSDAAIEIAQFLKMPWRLLKWTRFIPRSWRDAVYDLIAGNRTKIWGRLEACYMPPPDLRERFLD